MKIRVNTSPLQWRGVWGNEVSPRQSAVGRVISILADGRANVIVKAV